MSTQIIVDAEVIGLSLKATCDYTFGNAGCLYLRNGDPGDAPEPSEVEITALMVEVGGKWIDCMYLMDSELSDKIYDAIAELADQVAIDGQAEARADAAEYRRECERDDAMFAHTI